jgi:hypothetical protein
MSLIFSLQIGMQNSSLSLSKFSSFFCWIIIFNSL